MQPGRSRQRIAEGRVKEQTGLVREESLWKGKQGNRHSEQKIKSIGPSSLPCC